MLSFDLYVPDKGWKSLDRHFKTSPKLLELLTWFAAKACPTPLILVATKPFGDVQDHHEIDIEPLQSESNQIQNSTPLSHPEMEQALASLKPLLKNISCTKHTELFHIESHWNTPPNAHRQMMCVKSKLPDVSNVEESI